MKGIKINSHFESGGMGKRREKQYEKADKYDDWQGGD